MTRLGRGLGSNCSGKGCGSRFFVLCYALGVVNRFLSSFVVEARDETESARASDSGPRLCFLSSSAERSWNGMGGSRLVIANSTEEFRVLRGNAKNFSLRFHHPKPTHLNSSLTFD